MPTIVAHPQPSDNAPRRKRPTLHDEVDAKLPTTERVPWPGKVNREGYGPYRVTYVRHHGPVPKGLMLDHTCHSRARCDGGITCPHRACVNPAHLEPVTPSVNFRRSLISRGFVIRSPLGWPTNDGRCR